MLIIWTPDITPSFHLAGCNVAVNVTFKLDLARFQTKIPEVIYDILKHCGNQSECMFTNHFSNMVNACRKHVGWYIFKTKSLDEYQLEAHYQYYHPILMDSRLLPDGLLPPAGWDQT